MKFTLMLLAGVVAAAPVAMPGTAGALSRRQFDILTDLFCAHDHLRTNADCNAKKAAAGQSDLSILLDPLGLSLGKGSSSGYGY